MQVELNKDTKRTTLDDFQVGDGVLDLETNKLYIVSQDLEERVPGKLIDDDDEKDVVKVDSVDDDDHDYEFDPDYDPDEKEDRDDEDDGYEPAVVSINHGYFLYDVDESNQVGRKHKTGPAAAIKSYLVRDLKHDFKRIPADQLVISVK